MVDDSEIEEKFWSELKGSPFIMLGVEGTRDGATQPMTVQFEDQDRDAGVLWIFTANDHDLTRAMGQSNRAIGSYSAKGHGLFASLRGTLEIVNDRRPSTGCGIPSSLNGMRARTIQSSRSSASTSRTRRSGRAMSKAS